MERNQKQQYQFDDGQEEQDSAGMLAREENQEMEEVVPGVPVIRNSTPRPLSFDTMASYSGYFQSLQPVPSTFPERAPSAPPLPEELEESDDENELDAGVAVHPIPQLMLSEGQQEFITTNPRTDPSEMSSLQGEQNTDPLPAAKEDPHASNAFMQKSPTLWRTNWSLVVFSVYLAVLLFILLTFAVIQGMVFGQSVLTNNFTPLGVPWLVIMYGLLGGCVSSLITLGQVRSPHPPLFVVVTWFARPYIGAVLAIFAYILLTSGLFIVGQNVQRHMAFFWLVGALAGFCEGWVFFRRR